MPLDDRTNLAIVTDGFFAFGLHRGASQTCSQQPTTGPQTTESKHGRLAGGRSTGRVETHQRRFLGYQPVAGKVKCLPDFPDLKAYQSYRVCRLAGWNIEAAITNRRKALRKSG
jgi:hypothetical protein